MFLYQSRLKLPFFPFSLFLSLNYVAIVVKSENIGDNDYDDDKDCGRHDLSWLESHELLSIRYFDVALSEYLLVGVPRRVVAWHMSVCWSSRAWLAETRG